ETSLNCPICRKRLGIWSRRASKQKSLLDQSLWEEILALYPELVEERRNGKQVIQTSFTVSLDLGGIKDWYDDEVNRQRKEEDELLKQSELLAKSLQKLLEDLSPRPFEDDKHMLPLLEVAASLSDEVQTCLRATDRKRQESMQEQPEKRIKTEHNKKIPEAVVGDKESDGVIILLDCCDEGSDRPVLIRGDTNLRSSDEKERQNLSRTAAVEEQKETRQVESMEKIEPESEGRDAERVFTVQKRTEVTLEEKFERSETEDTEACSEGIAANATSSSEIELGNRCRIKEFLSEEDKHKRVMLRPEYGCETIVEKINEEHALCRHQLQDVAERQTKAMMMKEASCCSELEKNQELFPALNHVSRKRKPEEKEYNDVQRPKRPKKVQEIRSASASGSGSETADI
ncbi:hypothetical protein QYM36_003475, partial [Artemia franciscana]